MSIEAPILVTGAAGRTGGVGGEIVDILRSHGLLVRALVRTDDDRAEALRATGAEVVVGDLTRVEDVARALEGCRRMYFGMSVSASYVAQTQQSWHRRPFRVQKRQEPHRRPCVAKVVTSATRMQLLNSAGFPCRESLSQNF